MNPSWSHCNGTWIGMAPKLWYWSSTKSPCNITEILKCLDRTSVCVMWSPYPCNITVMHQDFLIVLRVKPSHWTRIIVIALNLSHWSPNFNSITESLTCDIRTPFQMYPTLSFWYLCKFFSELCTEVLCHQQNNLEPILWKDRTVSLCASTEISLCCHLEGSWQNWECFKDLYVFFKLPLTLTIALIPCWKSIELTVKTVSLIMTLTCDVFIISIRSLNYLF